MTDTGNYRIQVFSVGAVFLGKWGTEGGGEGQFDYPTGIAVDRKGKVYVADTGKNRVVVYSVQEVLGTQSPGDLPIGP